MIFDAIQSLSLVSLFAVLAVALVSASEIGHRLGSRFGRGPNRDKDANLFATATFALLALLIAFTYAMALTRYDMRRQGVLDEANAIRNVARVAPLLPDDAGTPILNELRRYVDLRIGLGVPYDPAKFESDVNDTATVDAGMWARLDAVVAAQPASLPAYRMVGALQALDDAGEKRTTALRNHVPGTIYVMLGGTALVAMGFAGFGAGSQEANRRVSATIMAMLLAASITITLDLQRPDRGTVEIPVQPLVDAAHALAR